MKSVDKNIVLTKIIHRIDKTEHIFERIRKYLHFPMLKNHDKMKRRGLNG